MRQTSSSAVEVFGRYDLFSGRLDSNGPFVLGCRLSERVLAIDLAGLVWVGSSSGILGCRLSERVLAIDFATAHRLGLLLSFAVAIKGPSKIYQSYVQGGGELKQYLQVPSQS